MIVAESVGFAGTHTICGILEHLPDFEVMHGSQTWGVTGPEGLTGPGRQSPEDFAAGMARAAQAGARPVAVHCLFPPAAFKPACDRHGIRYSLLVRDPARQIDSCYAWALGKVLSGDQSGFVAAMQLGLPALNGLGVRATLSNTLFTYAAIHVARYTMLVHATGAPVLRMEDLLEDEAQFRAAFDVPGEVPLGHFTEERVHLWSHRKSNPVELVAEPDRAAILERLRIDVEGRSWSVAGMAETLGYAR